jgi:SAM-dependent methyltransferase
MPGSTGHRDLEILSPTICPVCAMGLDTESLPRTVLYTPRGPQTWAKCSGCKSFFALEPYDAEGEVQHTRTRPWGINESGIALNYDKAPMFDAILRALRRFATPGCSLLDIGCSYGGFLERARDEGYRVMGMDIVTEAIEHVRKQGIPCECAGSAVDLTIPANSLEIVSVLDCNYYWPNQRKELRAIRYLLRPDGLIVMRVVDTSWAIEIGLWLQRWFPETGRRLCENAVYDHRVSIPVRSLLRIVEEEGFEIVYLSQRDAIPFRHNSLKIKAVYAVAYLARMIGGWHLAPGCVFLARKRAR